MAEMIDIFTEQNQKIGTVSKKEYYTYKIGRASCRERV